VYQNAALLLSESLVKKSKNLLREIYLFCVAELAAAGFLNSAGTITLGTVTLGNLAAIDDGESGGGRARGR
jgi:hypothetical protein